MRSPRAPAVALEFQGRSGKAERRKVVASYRPSEILSEGEQKVLALADFLAESRMRGIKAPIVFDDPVTSLDYRRLQEVSSRIAKLAESHQVIVFTHNITFASTLISMRQGKKLRCKFYEVRDSGETKGILAADVEPRQDTPAEIAKRINSTIESAKPAEPAVQDALVEHGYDLVRAWCEVFVEQELLNNVTQRYRANIMMARLTSIHPERFSVAAAVVGPMFDKASRCMSGHSQPAEQLNVRPTNQHRGAGRQGGHAPRCRRLRQRPRGRAPRPRLPARSRRRTLRAGRRGCRRGRPRPQPARRHRRAARGGAARRAAPARGGLHLGALDVTR